MSEPAPAEAQGHLGAILALAAGAAIAAFGVIAPLLLWVITPAELPPPFTEQNQDAETLIFLLTFAVALPAALFAVPRMVERIAAGPNRAALGPLAALATMALLGLLLFVKVSERLPWEGGLGALLAASLAWLIIVAAAALRLASTRPLNLPGGDRLEPALWAVDALLAVAAILSFVTLRSIAIGPLAIGAVAVGVLVAAWGRPLPRPSRRLGIAWDVVAVVLLVLAVPNLTIFAITGSGAADDRTILQFHQNFFLGPANQILGGGAMLVDTLSQYGVGSIYFLAGAFQVLPIGNGTLGLVEGLLAAATFVAAYLVLRAAGATRLLASSAMVIALVALVYSLHYPIGGLLQHGAIRFGLPAGVLVAAVAAARWPERRNAARALELLTVGIASIWALEAFAYTLLTWAGIVALETWLRPRGERLRPLLSRIGAIAAACVAAHVILAAATLIAAGELPDWGMYIETLRSFLVGGVGDLTYDFAPWTPALAVGALYIASAAAIVLLVRSDRPLAERLRVPLIALAGSTAWGIALFTYFVNRSSDHILPYICLPAVMVGCLWLAVILRADTPVSDPIRRASVGVFAGLAVLLVAVAWSSVGTRLSQSALAHVVPGGQSFGDAWDELIDPPELTAGALVGESLLERYMPDEDESIVLTSADLGVEVLVRTGRINRIPLADPWEESLVPSEHLPALEEAVDGLEVGDRVLLDAPAGKVFAGYRREPERDPLAEPFSQSTIVPTGIAILQEWALDRIGERFKLRTIARGGDGVYVAELVER